MAASVVFSPLSLMVIALIVVVGLLLLIGLFGAFLLAVILFGGGIAIAGYGTIKVPGTPAKVITAVVGIALIIIGFVLYAGGSGSGLSESVFGHSSLSFALGY